MTKQITKLYYQKLKYFSWLSTYEINIQLFKIVFNKMDQITTLGFLTLPRKQTKYNFAALSLVSNKNNKVKSARKCCGTWLVMPFFSSNHTRLIQTVSRFIGTYS